MKRNSRYTDIFTPSAKEDLADIPQVGNAVHILGDNVAYKPFTHIITAFAWAVPTKPEHKKLFVASCKVEFETYLTKYPKPTVFMLSYKPPTCAGDTPTEDEIFVHSTSRALLRKCGISVIHHFIKEVNQKWVVTLTIVADYKTPPDGTQLEVLVYG